MIKDLKPYPSYKLSGIPWVGEIPEHWKVFRLIETVDLRVSNVDKINQAVELPVRLCNYTDVYKNRKISNSLNFMKASATIDEIRRFGLKVDDVLITKDSEMWNDIGVPSLVDKVDDDVICGYHLAILRPDHSNINGEFLLFLLQAQGICTQFYKSANGVTRYGLTQNSIKNIKVLIPPPLTSSAPS